MLGWELPPHNSGGLGVACYQLCKALAHKGVDIEFILPYTAEDDIPFMKVRSVLNFASPSYVLPTTTAYDSMYYKSKAGPRGGHGIYEQQRVYEETVPQLIESREFDIIHAHDWLTFRAALRLKQQTRKPLILHIHSIESDRAAGGYGNPLVKEIEYLAMTLADRIVAVSRLTKSAIVKDYNIPPEKIEVVHNSLEFCAELQENSANAYTYLTSMKNLGYRVVANIGRLTIQKGLYNFLQAAQKVIDKAPKTLFLIVGSGEQYNELVNLSAQLGISGHVLFAGFQRGKKWRDSFKVADLLVLPSVSEPFGLTPLEAAGFGTPVLISKQSGVSEVFRSCLKVDYWDIDEMASQIVTMLRYGSLQSELKAAGYKELQSLSWDTAADKLVSMYELQVAGELA